jgi:hypothetical protein
MINNGSRDIVIQILLCYNKDVFNVIVVEYFYSKSKVVKLYCLTRTTPVLTRLDVRVFYGINNSLVTPAGIAWVFDPP